MINKKNNNISSVVAGITGAAIGFGIAAVGAVAVLSDKKSSDKVKKALANVKNKTMSYLEDVQKKTDKQEKEEEKKLAN
jgi:translation elongation factor EF-1beta